MLVCRTCMSRYELTPLFGKFSVVKFSSEQLFLATGLKIEPDDALPQSACRPCIKKIAKVLDFREISSKVDQMLRSFMIKPNNNILIKTEPNEDDINVSHTISIVRNFDDGTPERNGDKFVLHDIKKCHDDDSGSNESISLAKFKDKLDRKPIVQKKEFKYDVDVFRHYSKEANDAEDNEDSDVDDPDSDVDNSDSYNNVDITVSTYQEGDTKPMLEININDRKPIFDDENNTDEAPVTDKDGLSILNNATHGKDLEVKTCNTAQKETKETDYNQIEKKYCNLQFDVSHLTEEERASGKISSIKMEDIISKEDIDEIFSDSNTEQLTKSILDTIKKCKDEHKSVIDDIKNIGIPKLAPNVITHRYGNYIKQMREKEMASMRRKKEKGATFTRRSPAVNRRSDEAIERDKKLLSLAVTPFPPNGPVQCKLCSQRVRSVVNFKVHAKTHFAPEFACESCGKAFYNRSHMRYHQQRMHGSEKRLACPRCAFRAVDTLTLRNHERAEHTGERPYVCAECGVAFRMRNNLIQHLKTHFGVKNIQCELCPSLFTRRSQLWGHQMKVHFMTYTYYCYLCPETYKSLRPVKNHLLNVHAIPENQQLKIKCVKTRKKEVPGTSFAVPDNPN